MSKKKLIIYARRLLIIPPIAVGVFVFVLVIKNRQTPTQNDIPESVFSVRVIETEKLSVRPKALGYGNVQPKKTWKAFAEVSGKIVKIHPDLKKGNFFKSGQKILFIDKRKILFKKAETEANIANIKAQIKQLLVEESNFEATEKIERATLEVQKTELDRLEKLSLQNFAESQSSVDSSRRAYFTQKAKWQLIQNSIDLIPSRIEIFNTQLALHKAQLQSILIDLENSTIKVPFDCRMDNIDVEERQFVQTGALLFEAYGIETTEVLAQFPVDKIRHLLTSKRIIRHPNPKSIAKMFNVQPIIRLKIADRTIEWKEAYFSRIDSEINPKTRTIGIVVAVDNVFKKIQPGVRPPLTKGMFCEVELIGSPRKNVILIPRLAIHQNFVYVVGKDNRLERHRVKVAFTIDDFSAIKNGLHGGEKIIVSDVVPAIEGMLLETHIDQDLTNEILKYGAKE